MVMSIGDPTLIQMVDSYNPKGQENEIYIYYNKTAKNRTSIFRNTRQNEIHLGHTRFREYGIFVIFIALFIITYGFGA